MDNKYRLSGERERESVFDMPDWAVLVISGQDLSETSFAVCHTGAGKLACGILEQDSDWCKAYSGFRCRRQPSNRQRKPSPASSYFTEAIATIERSGLQALPGAWNLTILLPLCAASCQREQTSPGKCIEGHRHGLCNG